jgi:hypothetical protein
MEVFTSEVFGRVQPSFLILRSSKLGLGGAGFTKIFTLAAYQDFGMT